jgi:hypothetical protein
MAPVAMILGGIIGTVSALFGWLLFGLSLWVAIQIYFLVSLFVATMLIVLAMSHPLHRQHGHLANWQNT